VILCVSFVMSVFAPFPLSLAIILYGRTKGYLTGLMGLGLSFMAASYLYQDLTLFGFYFSVMLLGFGVAEVVLRGISPAKGLVAVGLGFIFLMGSLFTSVLWSQKLSAQQLIQQQLEKGRDKLNQQKMLIEQSAQDYDVEALQLLEHPDKLAKVFLETMPGYLFIAVFLMLWFNMFLVLKSRRLLLSGHDYPFSEKNLLNFKVPFGFVFLLVIGLLLAVWGKQLEIDSGEVIGVTIIKCLGIFYFFQGFGVLSELLSFLGVVGFFRTLIVVFVIFTGKYLIAAAGLFDNWFDFRKYFKKPKNLR
jgi:uncharacterized protein YybS (DUF2232 family)